MIPHRLGVVTAAALLALLVLVAPAVASAQPTSEGPTVVLDQTDAAPGDRLSFTLEGFEGPAVTISICGNAALRGSADCNMIESEGLRLNREGGPTISSLPVAVPPAACPCVVRVVTTDNSQFAVAPLVITGHPVEPTVAPAQFVQPLAVTISVETSDAGLSARARSSAGGPTAYDVHISVRNRSTQSVDGIRLSGTAGRSDVDDLINLDLNDPGTIEPGHTWEETVTAEVPAPVWGSLHWSATASGTGPSVTSSTTTEHRPVLLIALVIALVIDLLILAVRFVLKRLRRGRKPRPVSGADEVALDQLLLDDRESEFV